LRRGRVYALAEPMADRSSPSARCLSPRSCRGNRPVTLRYWRSIAFFG